MSWGLFNHNVQINPNGSGLPGDEVTDINAEDILVGSAASAHVYYEGIFGIGGGKILASPNGDVWYLSTDGGNSWSERGALPSASSSFFSDDIAYQFRGDCWFYSAHYGATRDTKYYRSTDDGLNWTQIITSAGDFASTSLLVDQEGSLVLGDQAGRLYKLTTPESSDGFTTLTYSPSIAANCDNLVEINGKYIYSRWSGASNQHWIEFEGDLSAATLKEYAIGGGDDDFASWASNITDKALVGRSSLATGTSIIYNPIVLGASEAPEVISVDMGENIQPARFGWGRYFLLATPSTANLGRWKLKESAAAEDGSWRATGINLNLEVNHKGSGVIYTAKYFAGNTWIGCYQDASNIVHIMRFNYGVATGYLEPEGELPREINKQSPDIFYKLDDVGSPASVVDLGRKGYLNTTANTITFEQAGLVADGGTAALFGNGRITAAVLGIEPTWPVGPQRTGATGTAEDGGPILEGSIMADGTVATTKMGGIKFVSPEYYAQLVGVSASTELGGADDHVHLFILSHDNTAAARTILQYGDAWAVSLESDHKVAFSTWSQSITTTNPVTGLAATLVIVSIERQGGKVGIYINGSYEVGGALTLSSPSTRSLSIGGAGVTIDYYAMIPYVNANIDALQRAWGTPAASLPPAPTPVVVLPDENPPEDPPIDPDEDSPLNPPENPPVEPPFNPPSNLLFKADTNPVILDIYNPQTQQWNREYVTLNAANGQPEITWGLAAGPMIDTTLKKFGAGSAKVPSVGTAQGVEAFPPLQPTWNRFGDAEIGMQDFTFAFWFARNGFNYHRLMGSHAVEQFGTGSTSAKMYGGFSLYLHVDSANSRSSVVFNVGLSLQNGLLYQGAGLRYAARIEAWWLPTIAAGVFSYITVCRKNGFWYFSVDGQLAPNVGLVDGDFLAPVLTYRDRTKLRMGGLALSNKREMRQFSVNGNIDDVVFLLGEALYTQNFTPPTAAFVV